MTVRGVNAVREVGLSVGVSVVRGSGVICISVRVLSVTRRGDSSAVECSHWISVYRNSSFSFRVEQTFFSMVLMAQAITRLILRALWGQIATQRIQEMQSCSLTCFTLVLSMADTGHFAAHKPQLEHALVGLGMGPFALTFR